MALGQTLTQKLYLLALACSVSAVAQPTTARSQIIEDHLLHATSSRGTQLFPLNPASRGFEPLQGGVVLMKTNRSSELNQEANDNDKLSTEVEQSLLAVGSMTDLGAGAGLGLSHQIKFHQADSKTSLAPDNVREEFTKQTQSAVNLLVELTANVKAGMAIRYLYQDTTVLGNYFTDFRTPIKTTLVGYGSGLALNFAKGGLGYAYYPPLRGKAEILGEEKIIVEAGQIVADGFYAVNDKVAVGVMIKTWLHELDDRATGTTANDDNQTGISLYGLDVDQYVFPERLVLVGADYEASAKTALSISVGQETASFNFRDLARFNRVTVGQPRDEDPEMKSKVLRGSLKFTNQKLAIHVGFNFYSREADLPSTMDSAKYSSSGRDLFLMLGGSL